MKTTWRFLKKLKIDLPHDPAIPLLGVYPKEIKSPSWDSCTPTFTAAFFTVPTVWKQLECPSTGNR